jgi:hypothetical protein
MAGPTASGKARVTAMPSTLLSTAFLTSVASWPWSGLLEYRRSMFSCLAAAWAPLRTLSQNVSPGTSWVIISMV